jgi:hypothetical protein
MALTPLHLRVLLDAARKKVLELLHHDSWEELRGERTIAELLKILRNSPAISAVQFPPTNSALEFLCSFNNVRRDGNTAAHSATLQEMQDAVRTKALDTKERASLESLYAFAYNAKA